MPSFLFQDLFPFRESISLPPLLAVFRSKIVGCFEIKWNLEVYDVSNLPERSKLHDQISPKKFQNKKKTYLQRLANDRIPTKNVDASSMHALSSFGKYQEKPGLSKVAPNFALSSRRNSPFSCLKKISAVFLSTFKTKTKTKQSIEPRKKKTLTFHYTGCLVGILILAHCSPYITG